MNVAMTQRMSPLLDHESCTPDLLCLTTTIQLLYTVDHWTSERMSPLLDEYNLVCLTMRHLVAASNGGIVDLSASSPL